MSVQNRSAGLFVGSCRKIGWLEQCCTIYLQMEDKTFELDIFPNRLVVQPTVNISNTRPTRGVSITHENFNHEIDMSKTDDYIQNTTSRH